MHSSQELRRAFLQYFANLNHEVVASGSLVPANDPTLLFTNAGMVPFKDVFLGREQRPYSRACSSQRCVRAGGKHNDLDQVGYTARHHTFFEMLGNFSFGDYFKEDAIRYAWNFLTQELNIPAEKLWVTVYEDDDEAADIWLKTLKIDASRFSRCGEADNFWSMGDTGPCGPCTEIFYDHGPEIAGGPPGSPDQDGDRYVEIWNLVFMQYDRTADGQMHPLPKPAVDTGMGLERLAAVMQGVHNNYDTDCFLPLIEQVGKLAGSEDFSHTSMRVIADHIRSTAFLIADGVQPSNEGRGYVLRRIIRRAVRHGHKLGIEEQFFSKLVPALVYSMGEAYPELTRQQAHISRVLQQEELQFERTLNQGLKLLENDIAALTDSVIPGATIFRLYDTYGFPPDLTGDIARERGLRLDLEGFAQEMEKQRSQSQRDQSFASDYHRQLSSQEATQFTGYDKLAHHAKIKELFSESNASEVLTAGEQGVVVLDHSPFYAESGGQVGDRGLLITEHAEFVVEDTQKMGKAIAHQGRVQQGQLKLGDAVDAKVDQPHRLAVMNNHSATHLLHAALRQLLGTHIEQKGSLVAADRLRFDFSHTQALTQDELYAIEDLVNQQIRANLEVRTDEMPPEEAIAQGAMALFGEKYEKKVRVLSMGEFSKELCGGTHVHATGAIGLFKITQETGIAAGIRRIEAMTGEGAFAYLRQLAEQMDSMAADFKCKPQEVADKVSQQQARCRQLEKEIGKLHGELAQHHCEALLSEVEQVNGVNLLTAYFQGIDAKNLRIMLDHLRGKLGSGVLVLGSINGEAVSLVAAVTKDLTSKYKAGEIINQVAAQVGGRGGGRPDMAQAGGSQPENLPEALASVRTLLGQS